MKKIEVGKCEIQTGSLIMGAVAATGIGLIALGVKSFFDAKKISLIEEDSFDDEEEFEEYKFRKAVALQKKKNTKIRLGIAGVIVGALAAAVGISAFTPLKGYVVNDDYSLKADKAEKIDGAIKTVKELGGSIQESVQELKDVKLKVDKIKQFTGKLENVLDKIA